MAGIRPYNDEQAGALFTRIIKESTTYDELIKRLDTELIDFLNQSFALIIAMSEPRIYTEYGGDINSTYYTKCGFNDAIRPLAPVEEQQFDHYRRGDYSQLKRFFKGFNLSKFWYGHYRRRQAVKVVCAPPPLITPENQINTFTGLRINKENADKTGDINHIAVKEFIKHIKRMTGTDEGLFKWVVSWMASIVQNPAEIQGTALIIKAEQGTGKGIIFNTLRKILGNKYCCQAGNKQMITGRFNAVLENKILVFADELIFAGDHQAKETFKIIVSEESLFLEKKGMEPQEIRNIAHFLGSSNNEWVIASGSHKDRRFTIVNMDETFLKLPDEEKTRITNLFYDDTVHIAKYLYNYECVSVRHKYQTQEQFNQVELTLSGVAKYLVDALETIDETEKSNGLMWNSTIRVSEVFNGFITKNPNSFLGISAFGTQFCKMANITSKPMTVGGATNRYYVIPPKADVIRAVRNTIHPRICWGLLADDGVETAPAPDPLEEFFIIDDDEIETKPEPAPAPVQQVITPPVSVKEEEEEAVEAEAEAVNQTVEHFSRQRPYINKASRGEEAGIIRTVVVQKNDALPTLPF